MRERATSVLKFNQLVSSGGQFTNKTKMWFKVKWSTVDMNTAVVPSLSCDPGKLEKYVKFTTSPSFLTSSNQTKLTDLPDDVLLMLFLMLPPKDLIWYNLKKILSLIYQFYSSSSDGSFILYLIKNIFQFRK